MVLKQNIGVKWVKQQIKSFFSIQQFGLVLVIIVLDLTRCGCYHVHWKQYAQRTKSLFQ